MKNSIKFLMVSLLMVGAGSVSAATTTWDFSNAGDYEVSDSDALEVADGVGKLPLVEGPEEIENYSSPGYTRAKILSPSGDTLYFAHTVSEFDQDVIVDIIDISDPTTPTLVTTYESVVNPHYIAVDSIDETLFLVSQYGDVEIIDISDKNNPTQLSTYTPQNLARVSARVLSGDTILYLFTQAGQLEVVDISDTSNPLYVKTETYLSSFNDNFYYLPALNRLYLIAGTAGKYKDYYFYVIDTSDPVNPSIINNPVPQILNYPRNFSISPDGTILYMIDDTNGLIIYDISDPTNFVTLGTISDPLNDSFIELDSLNNIVYTLEYNLYLKNIDVTDTSNPEVTYLYSTEDDNSSSNFQLLPGNDYIIIYRYFGFSILDLDSQSYPSDFPYITPTTSQVFFSTIDSFSHTLGANNEGTVTYQVSPDNGDTWYYWDGGLWTETSATDGTETSSVTEVNTNITTLDTDGGDFLWRAYLNSDGTEQVELDEITVEGSFVAAPEPEEETKRSSRKSSSRRLSQAQVDAIFGTQNQASPNEIHQLQLKLISLLTQLIAMMRG